LVPVLTQNSLAKVVHLICDTVATEVILRALQFGKHVIAAQNAADPIARFQIQTGKVQFSAKLLHAMQDNLQQIQEYGVELVSVQNLAQAVQQALQPVAILPEQKRSLPLPTKPAFMAKSTKVGICGKAVLSAMQIQQAVSNGEHRLVVEKGSLITPLAKDIAQNVGIEIVIRDH
jgi:hypothetical protein